MALRDTLLALLVAAIWGFAFVAIRIGVEEMPPLTLTAMRFLFSALPAVFFVPAPKAKWWLVAAFGFVLGVLKFGLLFSALKLGMPAGLSSLIMPMQAFWTMFIAAILFKERPLPVQLLGAAVALAGIAVIAVARGSSAPLTPLLMVLAASIMWGIANIISKYAQGADMLSFVVWASLVPPLPLIALSLTTDGVDAVVQPLIHPTWRAALMVFILAIPTTVFAFSIWTRLLKTYPASVVAPFALLIPIFGLGSSWAFLGETIAPTVMLGVALVLAGLAINVFGPEAARQIRR